MGEWRVCLGLLGGIGGGGGGWGRERRGYTLELLLMLVNMKLWRIEKYTHTYALHYPSMFSWE